MKVKFIQKHIFSIFPILIEQPVIIWEECPFIISQRDDLINELSRRRLGPSGQRLLVWLEHGGDLTTELEELLRKVCLKIPAKVWSPTDGCLIDQGHLDADTIIDSMATDLQEERKGEALNRWAFGCKPEPEDIDLLAHLLEPDEMAELKRRYICEPPYCHSPSHLPFESVDEEETLD